MLIRLNEEQVERLKKLINKKIDKTQYVIDNIDLPDWKIQKLQEQIEFDNEILTLLEGGE